MLGFGAGEGAGFGLAAAAWLGDGERLGEGEGTTARGLGAGDGDCAASDAEWDGVGDVTTSATERFVLPVGVPAGAATDAIATTTATARANTPPPTAAIFVGPHAFAPFAGGPPLVGIHDAPFQRNLPSGDKVGHPGAAVPVPPAVRRNLADVSLAHSLGDAPRTLKSEAAAILCIPGPKCAGPVWRRLPAG